MAKRRAIAPLHEQSGRNARKILHEPRKPGATSWWHQPTTIACANRHSTSTWDDQRCYVGPQNKKIEGRREGSKKKIEDGTETDTDTSFEFAKNSQICVWGTKYRNSNPKRDHWNQCGILIRATERAERKTEDHDEMWRRTNVLGQRHYRSAWRARSLARSGQVLDSSGRRERSQVTVTEATDLETVRGH